MRYFFNKIIYDIFRQKNVWVEDISPKFIISGSAVSTGLQPGPPREDACADGVQRHLIPRILPRLTIHTQIDGSRIVEKLLFTFIC